MGQEKTFEENMAGLETILEALQDDSTGLEQSVSLYSDAAVLLERCEHLLAGAKIRIDEISVKMQKAEDFHAE